jgi:hypothetical protein
MKQRSQSESFDSLAPVAQRLWRALPFLWQEELRLFVLYEASVDQDLTEEGLELWMTRVQAGECPVAGSGCDKPKQSRFCARHRVRAPSGL